MPVRRILVYVVCRSAETRGAGPAGRRRGSVVLTEAGAHTAQARLWRELERWGICPAPRRPRAATSWWLKRHGRFPYLAIRSEIAARILRTGTVPPSKRRSSSSARSAASRPARRIRVPTLMPRGLPDRVVRCGVTTLCDVRRNPLSRKYGFSKKTLGTVHAQALGFGTSTFRSSGIASDERRDLASRPIANNCSTGQTRDAPPGDGGADAHHGLVDEGDHDALTCFEHRPTECQRWRVTWQSRINARIPWCGSSVTRCDYPRFQRPSDLRLPRRPARPSHEAEQ